MKTMLSALLISALAVPVWPCGGESYSTKDMIQNDARAQALVGRLLAAQKTYDAADKQCFAEFQKDPRAIALSEATKSLEAGTDAYNKANDAYWAYRAAAFDGKLEQRAPVRVKETAYLCGNETLECGHSINKGSSWYIVYTPDKENFYIQVSGAEMHYLMKHGKATAWTFSRLELVLDRGAVAASAKKIVTSLLTPDWR